MLNHSRRITNEWEESEAERHSSSARLKVLCAPTASCCSETCPESLQSSWGVFSEYLLIRPRPQFKKDDYDHWTVLLTANMSSRVFLVLYGPFLLVQT